jgi:hypothetical protein
VATEPAFRLVVLSDKRRLGEVVRALEWAEIRALGEDSISQRRSLSGCDRPPGLRSGELQQLFGGFGSGLHFWGVLAGSDPAGEGEPVQLFVVG